jgi:MerR family redox-sensitive transcriptional activator SoxR
MRPSALRYYESIGVLPNPQRESGQRRYEAGVLQRIEFIQAAKRAGFSMEEMKLLLGIPETETPYSERLQELAREKLAELEEWIIHAQAIKKVLEAGLDCRCANPEDCSLFITQEE